MNVDVVCEALRKRFSDRRWDLDGPWPDGYADRYCYEDLVFVNKSCKYDVIRVRKDRSFGSRKIYEIVSEYTRCRFIKREGDWIKVRVGPEGPYGWVREKFEGETLVVVRNVKVGLRDR